MPNKILICDDEKGVREALKLILNEHYDLILTDNGSQCLECLERAKDIGLVFLDLKMPHVNGLDILKLIKKKTPQVNVIIITGYKSVETAAESVRLGAAGYIVKPFQSEEILSSAQMHSNLS